MTSITQRPTTAHPPSSYSPVSVSSNSNHDAPINPMTPMNPLVREAKEKAPSTRSSRSSQFSFKFRPSTARPQSTVSTASNNSSLPTTTPTKTSSKGLKKVFGLLSKPTTQRSSSSVLTNRSMSVSQGSQSPGSPIYIGPNFVDNGAHGAYGGSLTEGEGTGLNYKSRHARSMEALKLFTKSAAAVATPQLSILSPKSLAAERERHSSMEKARRDASLDEGALNSQRQRKKANDVVTPVLTHGQGMPSGENGETSSADGSTPRHSESAPWPANQNQVENQPQPQPRPRVHSKSMSNSSNRPQSQRRSQEHYQLGSETGIGGMPPPGAKGAVVLPDNTPEHRRSSTEPAAPAPLVRHGQTPSTTSAVSISSSRSASASADTTPSQTIRTKPLKPTLSIPIPPPPTHPTATATQDTAALLSALSSATATPGTVTATTGHSTIKAKTIKSPPSPGHSLRLTPSIVMKRPAWPLPPLPTTLVSPSTSGSTSGTNAGSDSTGGSTSGSSISPPQMGTRKISNPLVRLIPPRRSMTSPTNGTPTQPDDLVAPWQDEGDSTPVRRRRSEIISAIGISCMPSLNVMGETEHGDPEDDDDDDDSDDEEGMEEEESPGRPSLDSMASMDSVATTDTVRAAVPPQPFSVLFPSSTPSRFVPAPAPAPAPLPVPSASTSTSTAAQASSTSAFTIAIPRRVAPSRPLPSIPSPVPEVPDKGKGKGKGKGPEDTPAISLPEGDENPTSPDRGDKEDDEDGSASDSDDSVYFDARASVILSPKEIVKVMERRQSQRQSVLLAAAAAANRRASGQGKWQDSDAATERSRRDSSWSFSTAGRESVYLTPKEGSAFWTPGSSNFLVPPENNPAFANAIAMSNKRSSVPIGLGLPTALAAAAAMGGRRERSSLAAPPSGLHAASIGSVGSSSSQPYRTASGTSAKSAGSSSSQANIPLPGIDLSSLGFDASNFSASTPTQVHGQNTESTIVPVEGLPISTSKRGGLPNFDAAVSAAVALGESSGVQGQTQEPQQEGVKEADEESEVKDLVTPISMRSRSRSGSQHDARTPRNIDYFTTKPVPEIPSVPSIPSPSAGTRSPYDTVRTPSDLNRPGSLIMTSTIGKRSSIRQSQIIEGKRLSLYRQMSRSMVDISTSSKMDEDEDVDDGKAGNGIVGPPDLLDSSYAATGTLSARRSPSNAPVDHLSWIVPPPTPIGTRPPTLRRSTLRRVSSVPALQPGDMQLFEKPPPDYNSIPRREDEGREVLPGYSNDIALAGLFPRKMEFDQPGVQARDRSWKKFWCVLQGTMFRVYKVGTLEVKFGALAGAPVAGQMPANSSTAVLSGGRVRSASSRGHTSSASVSQTSTSRNSGAATGQDGRPRTSNGLETTNQGSSTSGSNSEFWKIALDEGTTQSAGSILTKNQQTASSGFLAPPPSAGLSSPGTANSNGSRNSGSSYTPSRSSFSQSRPSTPSRPGTSMSSYNSANSPHSQASAHGSSASPGPMGHGPGGRGIIDNGGTEFYTPMAANLVYQFTLQGAESGLATDYLKRRNVIRVRLEGQQFLLQMPGVEEVVEWIEGFQAAANIATDLDIRPMPRGALYPRRRRRRRIRQPGEPATQSPLSPPPNLSLPAPNATLSSRTVLERRNTPAPS